MPAMIIGFWVVLLPLPPSPVVDDGPVTLQLATIVIQDTHSHQRLAVVFLVVLPAPFSHVPHLFIVDALKLKMADVVVLSPLAPTPGEPTTMAAVLDTTVRLEDPMLLPLLPPPSLVATDGRVLEATEDLLPPVFLVTQGMDDQGMVVLELSTDLAVLHVVLVVGGLLVAPPPLPMATDGGATVPTVALLLRATPAPVVR